MYLKETLESAKFIHFPYYIYNKSILIIYVSIYDGTSKG